MPIGWQHYECVLVENHRQGIAQIPVAAADDTTPCEIVKAFAAAGKRVVRWVVAARASTPAELPEVPAAREFTADAVLEEREVAAQNPIPCSRGIYLYIAWGVYTYAMKVARGVDTAFPIPALPPSISQLGDAAQLFPAAKFRRFLDTGSFTPTTQTTGSSF